MREPNWKHINEVFIKTFINSEELTAQYDLSIESELLEYLKATITQVSPYLVKAILNDPVFYDHLLGGKDMILYSKMENLGPLLDVLFILKKSVKVKIQNPDRTTLKTFLTGEDKQVLVNMIVERINELQSGWIDSFEKGWDENPGQVRNEVKKHINNIKTLKKELTGKIYSRLYNTIPWPVKFKETDKCILIYRIGLLLSLDTQLDPDIVRDEEDFDEDSEYRQAIYHHVASIIRTENKRKLKKNSK